MSPIRNAVAVLVAFGLLTGCQRSAEELVDAVGDKPGVIDVEVVDNGGEDDLPFSSLPWVITVTMKADATARQIKDVAGAYEEDLKDEEVESVTINVGKRGVLQMGETTGETEPWAQPLADAVGDPAVAMVWVTAWTPDSDINVHLRAADFGTFQRFVQHYQRYQDLATLGIKGGAFSFYVTHHAAGGANVEARLQTAATVHQRFGLRGARVFATGSLRLVVGPGPELAAVRAFANQHAAPGTGRIIVVRAKHA